MNAKVTQLNFALIVFGLIISATGARGQAAHPQFYVVCVSQENLPTVYMSGVLQGPATAIQTFRTGFIQFLAQTYTYKGNVGCSPARTAANAETFVQARTNALHNQKKNLVQTGWTQGAASASGATSVTNVLGSLVGGGTSNTVAPAKAAAQTAAPSQTQAASQAAGASTAQGGNSSAAAPVVQIFNNLFGGGSSTGSGSTATPPASKASGATAPAPQAQTAANKASAASGASASANPTTEVASVLSGLFSKGSSSSASPNPTGNAAAQPKSGANGAGGKGAQPQQAPAAAPVAAASGLPAGALGMAQFANSKLTVYGCGRQGTQVLCVTDLTNQNAQDTLIQSAATWKDAFLVDDRGDRHVRTDGYFLNIDGDRRPQLDISYGQSAHFILAFDAVQTKVEKVTLRSTTGGLDVENIALIVPGASGEAQPAASQAQAGPAAH